MNEIILALLWDLFQHAETIDRSIGGSELAHMPTSCAALIVGLKRRVQEINAARAVEAEFPGEEMPFEDGEGPLSPLW